MAIYYARASIIKRSSGRSATGASAYRAGEQIYDERTGMNFDYRGRQKSDDIVHTELFAPAWTRKDSQWHRIWLEKEKEKISNASDEWEKTLTGRHYLWNKVETFEKNKRAQLAQEFIFALPHELTEKENTAMAREIADAVATRQGVAVDLAVHRPDAEGDQRNYHAHILITTRTLEKDGKFSKKRAAHLTNRAKGAKEIKYLRKLWADIYNKHLERKGLEERVDHRSYWEQGVDKKGMIKLGPKATELTRRTGDSYLAELNRQIKSRNDMKEILARLTKNKAFFTEHELEKALFRKGYDPEALKAKLILEGDILALYERGTGALAGYTTPQIREQEVNLLARVLDLAGHEAHKVSDREQRRAVSDYDLDKEQREALTHALEPGKFKIIEGRAGTGKSHTIGAIRQAAEEAGYRVIGLAHTNTVTSDLKKQFIKETRTVESMLWYVDNNPKREILPDKKTIMIVDEAAMLDTRQLDRLTQLAAKSGAKIILIGDDRQLSSIEQGGMFTEIKNMLTTAEMTHVRRQRDEWARNASYQFSIGNFSAGLQAYEDHGMIHWEKTVIHARRQLVDQWAKDTEIRRGDRFIFAYTNKDVDRINAEIHRLEIARDRITNRTIVETSKGEIDIGEGDKIQFRGTNKKLGILNGVVGTVQQISGGHEFLVKTDDGEKIKFSTSEFSEIDLGYAGTIYRGQGKTLDDVYLLHTPHFKDQASYVGLTRNRYSCRIYTAKDQVKNLDQLARQMSRRSLKHASLFYATKEEIESTQDLKLSKERERQREWEEQRQQQSRDQGLSL